MSSSPYRRVTVEIENGNLTMVLAKDFANFQLLVFIISKVFGISMILPDIISRGKAANKNRSIKSNSIV